MFRAFTNNRGQKKRTKLTLEACSFNSDENKGYGFSVY